MIRITTTAEGGVTTIKADGRLVSENAAELMGVWERCSGPVIVDLSGLSFADDEGAATLKKMRAGGAKLVGTRPYVALLLGEEIE